MLEPVSLVVIWCWSHIVDPNSEIWFSSVQAQLLWRTAEATCVLVLNNLLFPSVELILQVELLHCGNVYCLPQCSNGVRCCHNLKKCNTVHCRGPHIKDDALPPHTCSSFTQPRP